MQECTNQSNGYFLNHKNSIIQECLSGLKALVDPNKITIKINEKIVFLKNSKENKRVNLICGGGSGHEPSHAGFVCDGMLSAAVCGDIFSSPSHTQVLSAIDSVCNESGVLLIIKNYTGDIINFTLAQEISRLRGKNIEVLIIDDDISIENLSIGSRGLAGTVIVYKILGAMSQMNKSLSEITLFGNIVKKYVSTVGCSMKMCSMPFADTNKTITQGFVEFGLGIHGENGAELVKFCSTDKIIENLLRYFQTKNTFSDQDTIAIILNNLGSMTEIEMLVLLNSLTKFLNNNLPQLKVERIIFGKIMSSLDMKGFSLSVLNISNIEKENKIYNKQEILKMLDSPVDNQNWINYQSFMQNTLHVENLTLSKTHQEVCKNNESSKIFLYLNKLFSYLMKKESYLNEIDGLVGDADLGSGVSRSCEALLETIKYQDFTNNLKQAFQSIGETIAEAFGGTSGPLYAIFFIKGSSLLQKAEKDNSLENFLNAFIEGVNSIKMLGKAELGDRTMMDVLLPLSEFFKYSLDGKLNLDYNALSSLINKKADEVKLIQAKRGRSSYLKGKEIGLSEPGCELVRIWMSHLISEK